MLKAIETKYKGYRFRSRLEARWAVFFDVMGYEWVYEDESYDLDGLWYLPDFRVDILDSNGDSNIFFFEVKASNSLASDELAKFNALGDAMCSLGAGYGNIILLDGVPDFRLYKCRQLSDEYWLLDNGYRDRPSFWCDEDDAIKYAGAYSPLYRSAVEKARSARFEHGESGC